MAADIEHYPEYFAEFRQARLLKREGNELWAEQTLTIGLLTATFTSQAVLTPFSAIRIQAVDGPFDALTIDWVFAPLRKDACHVTLSINYRLRQALLNAAAALIIDRRFPAVLQQFQHQARIQLSRT